MQPIKNIASFFATDKNKISRGISYAGMAIGVLLLLASLQMYININQLLKEKNTRKNGADFISVTKTITNENMGSDNTFTAANIDEIKKQTFVEDAAPLISNQFRVKASAGNIIPFSTDLFLESLSDKFLDTVPSSFAWQPGQQDVPIIFSSDFLEMYNVFAPSQDLPQLSDKTISSVTIILECYGPKGVFNFRGRIVALSDRINSILVPENFMMWANKNFGTTATPNPARIYLKTKDANDPQLLSFLEQKDYRVNKDKTKFGRVKGILQSVVSGLGGFGVLVIILAMMLFSFYLQLMIAKNKDTLQLLLLLGYSPSALGKTVAKRFIPVYAAIIIIALLLTFVLQYFFKSVILPGRDEISMLPHWSVFVISIFLFILSIFINFRMVKWLLYKL